jgi:hypothetical protein
MHALVEKIKHALNPICSLAFGKKYQQQDEKNNQQQISSSLCK